MNTQRTVSLLAAATLIGSVPARAAHTASRYEILKSFGSVTNDGQSPRATLIEGSDGVLYGTTFSGGAQNLGTVVKLNKDGSGYSLLHEFTASDGDGQGPLAGLLEGPGLTNELQRATTLDGNWQTLTNLVVPPSGVAEFTDPAPPLPGAFYRSIGR